MAVYQGARIRPGFLGRGEPRRGDGWRQGEPALRRSHVVARVQALAPAEAGRRWGARGPGALGGRGSPGAHGAPAGERRGAHATLPLDRRPAADSIPRRRARGYIRAGRRNGRLGLLLGGIVVAFLLAFFSLAQTVRVTATDYEANRLLTEQAQLQAQKQELLSDLNRLGREPAVRRQAIALGLFPLAEPIVVRAR